MAEFRMPSLGADMDSGTLIAWHVDVGDHVERGDLVAEVDTDKSVIDVEVFAAGTVEEILVPVGERVPVGTPLAIIREDAPRTPPAGAPVRTAASPRARRRANDLGVDLADVPGTGPDGSVTAEDVERYAAARPPEAPGPTPQAEPVAPAPQAEPAPPAALSGADRAAALRHAVAASMARSKREIPHYYLTSDVDVTPAMAWLEAHNAAVPIVERILPATLLVKATAVALGRTPPLNGRYVEGVFRPGDGVHLGVAVALRGGGLVAPAIHDADSLPLPDLMAALRDLVNRARSGRVTASEAADPTCTVTNLGEAGADAVLPVIYPPQVAIVGFGRIRERPWVVAGTVVVRQVVTASVAGDHRVSDGRVAAGFLADLAALLAEPEVL